MANKSGVASLGPYILRVQEGNLFLSNDIAQEVKNLYPMQEGTLRTVWGPAALIDNRTSSPRGTETGRPTSSTSEVAPTRNAIVYGSRMHGIYHCTLKNGQRDVLLLHTGDELWEFQGWYRNWRQLLSPAASTYGLQANLIDDRSPQFPTQFECTGNGVVIVPQDNRAYFYDGTTIAPLGFSGVPSSPTARGPQSSKTVTTDRGVGVNDRGYTHDGTEWLEDRVNYAVGMTAGFNLCRVGTIANLTFDASVFDSSSGGGDFRGAANAGWLLAGEYRCKAQFIDYFGNLSALSPPSDTVKLNFQASEIPDPTGGGGDSQTVSADAMRKQIARSGIPTGPDHCIGRILYRTKDLINSGTSDYFRHTQNAANIAGAFATIPDNETRIYPDNIPDGFLIVPAKDVVPVPNFKLCRLAFGRLWIANMPDTPGMVRPSMPGRYGTFLEGEELYPDPSGGEITGLWAGNGSLLVFTRSGTFAVQPYDDGDGFRFLALSSQIGCEAPSSLATLGDGRIVWLGRDGFYAYDGSSIKLISACLRDSFKRVTASRMQQATAAYDPVSQEYRCWLSTDGEVQNTTCFVFDGNGWRTRTDVAPAAVCVTQDHRRYMLAAGKVRGDDETHQGVYVLDKSGNAKDTTLQTVIDNREALIETAWMQGQQSLAKNTTRVAYLWLRESEDADITVEVLRDWRNTTVETVSLQRYSGADVPKFYSSTPIGTPGATFVRRRPYWTRAQIYLPSNETFKFRIRGTGNWEFVGLQVDITPRAFGGAQVPP